MRHFMEWMLVNGALLLQELTEVGAVQRAGGSLREPWHDAILVEGVAAGQGSDP